MFTVVKDRSTATELVIVCPIPSCGDRTGNRSINLSTGATNCWRCNKGHRNFYRFCRSLGHEVDEEDIPVATVSELNELVARAKLQQSKLVPVVSEIQLPRGFIKVEDEPWSVYSKLVKKMAEKKHLEWQDMVQASVGFTRDDPWWEPYAIFPVHEWGRIVYFQGRKYRSAPGEPTKRFPSKSSKGAELSSRYWVYNIDEVRRVNPKTVIVVESILNVLSLEKHRKRLGRNDVVSVCVFKHAVSDSQLMKLSAFESVNELCLLFDLDATQAAWDQAPRISVAKPVSVAELPATSGVRNFDANDDVETAWKSFERRRRHSPSRSLRRKLDSL